MCARRARGIQINALSNVSQCFTPDHHSLLQPRLPLTPAVSGAPVWAEWLHHPCRLGGPQHGDKKWRKRGDDRGKIGAPGAITYSHSPHIPLLHCAGDTVSGSDASWAPCGPLKTPAVPSRRPSASRAVRPAPRHPGARPPVLRSAASRSRVRLQRCPRGERVACRRARGLVRAYASADRIVPRGHLSGARARLRCRGQGDV